MLLLMYLVRLLHFIFILFNSFAWAGSSPFAWELATILLIGGICSYLLYKACVMTVLERCMHQSAEGTIMDPLLRYLNIPITAHNESSVTVLLFCVPLVPTLYRLVRYRLNF